MANDDSPEALIARLIDGFDPGSFVTKWIVVAEFIDSDSDRAVICTAADEMTRWDTYGLLTDALMTEKAHHVTTRLRDDES